MRKAICIFLCICMMFVLPSCSKDDDDNAPKPNPDDPFYGDWYIDDNGFYTFYEFDGIEKVVITVFDISDVCAYSYDDTKITIKTRREDLEIVDEYSYSFVGDTLVLSNEKETITLKKTDMISQ